MSVVSIDRRAGYECWFEDIIFAVDIRVSDYLCVVVVFHHYSSHILVCVECIDILNNDDVCSVAYLFHNSQIVNISVAIEVKVAYLA